MDAANTDGGNDMAANLLQERYQSAQDAIAGDATLTAGLNQESAQILSNWGATQAQAWVASTTLLADEEQAQAVLREPLQRILATMRGINQLSRQRGEHSVDAVRDKLYGLFMANPQPARRYVVEAACQSIAADKDRLSEVDFIRRVVSLAGQAIPQAPDLAPQPGQKRQRS